MSRVIQAIKAVRPLKEIAILVDEEKDLNDRNANGKTLLDHVMNRVVSQPPGEEEYSTTILHMLLDHHVDTSNTNIKLMTPIVTLYDPSLFDKILENGFMVDLQDTDGQPLLSVLFNQYSRISHTRYNAINEDREQRIQYIIRRVLEHNPDVNLQDKDGYTVAHYIMNCPMTSFIMEILPRILTPENVNLAGKEGFTPLMMYASRDSRSVIADQVNQANVVDQLIALGVDIMIRDDNDQTAREIAMDFENDELAAILQQKELELKESIQGTLVTKGRKGFRHRIPPTIAKRITNFLGGKRRTRKGKKTKKLRRAYTRRRK